MAFVAHNGVHLSRLQQQQVAGESMRYAQRNGPAASAAWWRDVLNERPELAVLTRVVEDHMCLTSPQDLQREEELHCEVAKGVVGNAIAQDILGKEATLRGYWHADPQMRTGFPPSVPRLNRRLSATALLSCTIPLALEGCAERMWSSFSLTIMWRIVLATSASSGI